MKTILLGTILTAILTTTASADYKEAKEAYKEIRGADIKELSENSELLAENQQNFKARAGQFYDKAGFSFSYEKTLDAQFRDNTYITNFSVESGFNKSNLNGKFLNFGVDNYYLPFFFDNFEENIDSLFTKRFFALKTKLQATTFSYNDKKVLEDDRTSDFLAGAGFSYTEPYAFSTIDATYSVGLLNNVDSEIEVKYNISDFELSAKQTKIDDEKYNSFAFAYKIKF